MMVVFQNKIIYMPGLPPNARRENVADYKNQCSGIQWQEERIKSADGTRISLCVASVVNGSDVWQPMKTVYILYFQGHFPSSVFVFGSSYVAGNTSSIPPRLPFLSPMLRILRDSPSDARPVRYVMVCCSYRGYWTSRGRPSEKGIGLDSVAALKWIKGDHDGRDANAENKVSPVPVIIWGQSIGAGVATNLAAQHSSEGLALKTLILETPFLSVRAMLETLYPQKWLPYRHLWPFLRNHLDSWKALGEVRNMAEKSGIKAPNVLNLEAGKDELVPNSHGDMLERRCVDLGLDVTKKVIGGALHTEVMVRPEGRVSIVDAVQKVARS